MTHRTLLARRSRLAFPLLCAFSVLAASTPMLVAPHEASACSGSGPGQSNYRETAPRVQDDAATERNLIIVSRDYAMSFGVPSSGATGARLEKADGTPVPLSRNDFETPNPLAARPALVPTIPLDANAAYVLVVDGVVTASDAQGAVQSARVPFKTGEKLRADPPTPVIVGEKTRTLSEELPRGSICCGRSADYVPGGGSCSPPGKGTPDSCAPTQRFTDEIVSIGWQPGASSDSWGAGVSFVALVEHSVEAGKGGNTTLSVPPIGLDGVPFSISIARGGNACVTIVARDGDTGIEKSSPKKCFEAGPNIPPARTACDDLVPLVTSPKSKAGCETNAALLELLKECPGSPTNGGGGSNAGGANAGGASAGGSSAGGASAGGSSSVAGSGGGAGSSGLTPTPAPASDGGCSVGTVARSDGAGALAPIFAAIAGIWVARRRRG